ncbi:MAG TPA: terpene cyclase/mutase family protein [Kiritimatiellia bacterium]|nr:terpene cyclase/mutase family protein [Kiritimatiellia bacterium]
MNSQERDEFLRKYKLKRLMEHMTGPIGSIILHVLVVFLAVRFMVFEATEKQAEIEVMVVEPDAVDLEDFEKELEDLPDMMEMVDMSMPTDMPVMDAPVADTPNQTEDASMDLAQLNILNDSSPLVMKGLFAGRSAAGRESGLAKHAGRWAQVVDASVKRALEWLKRNQAADGSWGPNKPAMTGLGLLTFLAHGETTSSKEYGQTIEKAIRFLLSIQNDKGEFAPASQSASYAHPIATYAISEAYGLTRIPDLKPAMEKAIDVLLKGQQPGGSWDYSWNKGARRDTSVAGWCIQALKAGFIAGAENPGLKEAMDRASKDIFSAHNSDTGLFFYSGRAGGTISMTSVGVLSLQLLGHARSPQARAGLQALAGTKCDYRQPPSWPMYTWYYMTQAKFHSGGPIWTQWNNQFAPELTKNQNPDGSWTSAGQNFVGDGHGRETNYGLVYSTTLAALTLQVYYRFLPTYQPIAIETEEETTDEDVSIRII